LNIGLGSCGEFHSCYESCMRADQISEEEYEELDVLHDKVENQLLRLIESLQRKQKGGEWEDTFQPGSWNPIFHYSNIPLFQFVNGGVHDSKTHSDCR
jgi:hypothetical protein